MKCKCRQMAALCVVVFSCTMFFSAEAQNARKRIDQARLDHTMKADTAKKGPWKFGGTATLNLNQQNASNWVGTSEKYAFTLGAGADLYGNYDGGKNTWNNTLKMAYAFLNNESQGYRKTSDFMDFYTKYGRELNEKETIALAAIANLRTQFTDGFDYNQTPRRRVSGFFAPANVLVTPGIEWRPKKYFSLFFSPIAAKWVIVTNDPYSYSYPGGMLPNGDQQDPIAKLYGVDPTRKVDAQFGAFMSANFDKEIVKNVHFTSRLDLYSNYLDKPENIDIFWTNNLLFKVNKWLAITYQWNLAYDNDFVPEGDSGPRVQFLGNLGIGVSGKF